MAQVSKQGFVYVFDRVTGEPVWPIEELPVATDTDLEGEVMSPTQPFPTRPAAFEYQGTSIDDLVDFTPEIRQMAVEAVEGFRLGPLYTPQTLRGTIMRPPVGGGASWSGAAVDPETGYLYVPSTNGHSTIQLTEPEPHEQSTLRYIRRSVSAGPVMPRGLPLWKPPYTRMTAIDMNTGEHAWMVPTGDGDRIRNHPMLRDLDLPPVGGDASRSGPLLTKTLLILRPDGGRQRRRAAPRRLRQGDGGEDRVGRPARRGPGGAHDLPAGRRAAHRADRGRRGAGADRLPAARGQCWAGAGGSGGGRDGGGDRRLAALARRASPTAPLAPNQPAQTPSPPRRGPAPPGARRGAGGPRRGLSQSGSPGRPTAELPRSPNRTGDDDGDGGRWRGLRPGRAGHYT